MPSPSNFLPVYGSSDALLGYVTPAAAQRMLAAGQVVARGTRRTVRALVRVRDNFELLASDRPPTGQRYSHNRETRENPHGVWTFRKLANR